MNSGTLHNHHLLSRRFLGSALAATMVFITTSCEKTAKEAPKAAPPGVTVAKPVEREVTDSVEYTGRTAALQSVDIRARSGYLSKIFFKPGAEVKEGEQLFEIDRRTYKAAMDRADAQVRVAEVKLRQAGIELERMDELHKTGAATDIEWARHVAAKAATEAEVVAAKAALEEAKLNYEFTLIIAPISGRISRNLVNIGSLVQGGSAGSTLLTNIVSTDPIYADFDVDELTLLSIQTAVREGKIVSARNGENKIPVFLGLANEEGFPHQGTIFFVQNQVDSATGTLQVRAIFSNPQGMLSPGLFVRIRVPVGKAEKKYLISERALSFDQGQRFALVMNDKNTVEYRRVKVGRLENGLRAIEEGVGPQDWVIVGGLQRARPGMPVEPNRVEMESGRSLTAAAPKAAPPGSSTSSPAPVQEGRRP